MRFVSVRDAKTHLSSCLEDSQKEGVVVLNHGKPKSVVIGVEVRHATPEQARAAIAGYTVVNDVTARDFQYRSPQWLQGKTFESSTPVGPWLVTAEPGDEPEGSPVR